MNRRQLISLAALGLLMAGACLVVLRTVYGGVPTDEEACRLFQRQEHALNELIRRFQADTNLVAIKRHSQRSKVLRSMSADGRSKDVKLDGKTESVYYRLFRQVNCEQIVRGQDETMVELRGTGFEWLYPGGKKVYVFRCSAPGLLVTSIDDYRSTNRGRYDAYLLLTNSWFLKYVEMN
jgi:hypothetical protein